MNPSNLIKRSILVLGVVALATSAGLSTGCKEKGPAEQTGADIDKAIGEVKETAKEATEEAKEAAKKAGEELKEATEEAKKAAEKAAADVKKAAEEATKKD